MTFLPAPLGWDPIGSHGLSLFTLRVHIILKIANCVIVSLGLGFFLLHGTLKGLVFILVTTYQRLLAQNLAHSRCSVNSVFLS